jgi:hypothetical protein
MSHSTRTLMHTLRLARHVTPSKVVPRARCRQEQERRIDPQLGLLMDSEERVVRSVGHGVAHTDRLLQCGAHTGVQSDSDCGRGVARTHACRGLASQTHLYADQVLVGQHVLCRRLVCALTRSPARAHTQGLCHTHTRCRRARAVLSPTNDAVTRLFTHK